MSSISKRFSLPMKSSDDNSDANKRRRSAPFNLLRNMKNMPRSDISDTENLDPELEAQNEMFKNQAISANVSTCSTNNSTSSPPTKNKFKNIVLKLIPECRLKYKLQKNETKRIVGEHQPMTENFQLKRSKSYSFIDNNSEDSSDGKEMERSLDSLSSAGGINFNVPTKAMLKLYTFDERCDEGPISSVDNCENDYDEDTSFSLSMLTDDSWFDDKIRNDRIRLQQYISEASVSMETLIGTCLHTLGDNTRLTPAAQNYLMYQIRQAISISMLKLEGDVRSIFKKKEDLVLDVTDAYKVKLAQANDSHIRMQKRYEMMLSTADNKMLKQFEEISYLEKKMRSRINF